MFAFRDSAIGLMFMGISIVLSLPIHAAVLPRQNFLVVSSSDDTLAGYHQRFAGNMISGAAFRELVIAMNPEVDLRSMLANGSLQAGTILTLPGQETLKPFELLVEETLFHEPADAIVDHADSLDQTAAANENLAPSSASLVQAAEIEINNRTPLITDVIEQIHQTDARTHKVNYGDTLYSIARDYHVDMSILAKVNGLEPPFHLLAGQTLLIDTGARTHKVNYGDTLYGIAQDYRVDMLMLAQFNGLKPPFRLLAGQTLLIDSVNHASTRQNYQEPVIEYSSKSDVLSSTETSITHNVRGSQLAVVPAPQQQDRSFISGHKPTSSNHSEHPHELLQPSTGMLFCMSEPESEQLLAELRDVFQEALRGAFRENAFEPVTQYLQDLGYLRAEIWVDPEDHTSFMTTGVRYQVNNLDIAPKQRSLGDRGSHPRITLPVNQFYSPLLEQQLTTVAAEWLSEQGYPLFDVSTLERRFDDARKQVDLRLPYDASRIVEVTAVEHYGQDALSEQQLNTLSPFAQSRVYSQSSLERFRERLMATGYYKTVSFELLSETDRIGDGHRLFITTTPAQKDSLSAGLGHSPGRGAIINADIKLPNLTSNEDDLFVSGRVDAQHQQAQLAYHRSNVHWYGADIGFAASIGRDDQPYFTSDRVGLNVVGAWHGSNRADNRAWHVSLGRSNADERRLGALADQRFEYGHLAVGRSGRGEGMIDFARNWSVDFAHAFSLTAAADDYWSLSAATDWVLPAPLGRHFDLRMGADVRYADSLATIPYSAHLFHGGKTSNRGYGSASFSSLDLNANSVAFMAYTQFEMPWALTLQTPWLNSVIPFLDASVLGGDGDMATENFTSIGLGFAGEMAGYPYRVDLSAPLDSQAGNGLLVNFNLGL